MGQIGGIIYFSIISTYSRAHSNASNVMNHSNMTLKDKKLDKKCIKSYSLLNNIKTKTKMKHCIPSISIFLTLCIPITREKYSFKVKHLYVRIETFC